jgi:hypothetical protein
MREQISNADLQRLRHIRDGPQRQVARPAFDIRNVGAMQVGPPRQFLLGNAQLMPARPNDRADPRLEVGVGFENMVLSFHVPFARLVSRVGDLGL